MGSKIIADGDCSHETTRHLLLERKAMTNLDSILKSRDISLPTKVHLVKAMIFESWIIKLSIGELMLLNVVLENTLESPLDCKETVNPKGNKF